VNDDLLAAYLSGDLEPDEHAQIAAQLAGDAELRARTDRIAQADRMLAGLGDVELPEGFSQRLRDGLQPELDAILGDELAARRARRTPPPRWVTAGAAAAIAVVVGVGAILTGLGPGGQDAATITEDGAMGTTMGLGGESVLPPPEIVALGRTLTEDDLRALAQRDQFSVVSGLSAGDADELADHSQGQIQEYADAEAPPAVAGENSADSGESGTTAGGMAPGVSPLRSASGVDLSPVSACLPTVTESADAPLVPLYAELAEFDGEDVVVFVLLAPRGDSGEMSRVEVWVLTVDGCQTRYFTQHDT
jgi:hypothetical protein